MKIQIDIYNRIAELLKQYFPQELELHEDGKHLTIGETGIWMSVDDRELTVGYGFPHNHYDAEYDDLNVAIDDFLDLLTKRKRITLFYKGKMQFKNKTEFELNDGTNRHWGTASTWLFPYWIKTTSKVHFEEKIIDNEQFEIELKKLKQHATTYKKP